MGKITLSNGFTKGVAIELENGMYANLYMKDDPQVLNFVIQEAALQDNIEFRNLFYCVVDDKLNIKPDVLDDEKCKEIIKQNFNLRLNKWLQFKNLNQSNASENDIEEAFYVFQLECMGNVRYFYINLFKDEFINELIEYYHKHNDLHN